MIFNMSGGGGSGGGLNFAIVGGLTQPVSPKENTIWVNTDTTITSWVFAPEAPTNPEGGMIFFKTDKTSPVGFNALRKNEIAVLPTSAQQYIGGQWKNMEAYAFIGGTWVPFSWVGVFLYNRGNSFNSVTGGWTPWFSDGGSFTANQYSLDFSYSHTNGGTGAALATAMKIDLSNVKNIVVSLKDLVTTNNVQFVVAVTDSKKNDNHTLSSQNIASTSIKSGDVAKLDVSTLAGAYYVVLFIKATYKEGVTNKVSGSVLEVSLA